MDEKDAKRRHEVAITALQVFREKGYAGASMAAVARAAGIQKSSLYHHFPSKEAMFLAAISADIADPLRRAVELLEQEGRPAAERFEEALGCFYDAMIVRAIGPLTTVIAETSREVPTVAQGFHDHVIVPFRTTVTTLHAKGCAEGSFRPLPEDAVEQVIFGPLMAIAMTDKLYSGIPELLATHRAQWTRESFVRTILTVMTA